MQIAMEEAQIAYSENEIPIGCVIVENSTGTIIARSHNLSERLKNPNFHAEILAINAACCAMNSKNLSTCDIYITLEPCVMCASAIANARIKRVYYGADDLKHGGVENGARFYTLPCCFHRPEIYPGLLALQSELIMKKFFRTLRQK